MNEKLISPFRGTYNPDAGNQVSLFSYLKAFRFTGSPALYLECDIHMCHNRCPVSKQNKIAFENLTIFLALFFSSHKDATGVIFRNDQQMKVQMAKMIVIAA